MLIHLSVPILLLAGNPRWTLSGDLPLMLGGQKYGSTG